MAKEDEQPEEPNLGGRPPLFETPQEMEPLIESYFEGQDEDKRPYTVPGLALHLGFCDRRSLYAYMERDAENPKGFIHPIKTALSKIENQRVESLVSGEGNAAGNIFILKNSGYTDQQQHELTGKDGKDLHPEPTVTFDQAVGLITKIHDATKTKK